MPKERTLQCHVYYDSITHVHNTNVLHIELSRIVSYNFAHVPFKKNKHPQHRNNTTWTSDTTQFKPIILFLRSCVFASPRNHTFAHFHLLMWVNSRNETKMISRKMILWCLFNFVCVFAPLWCMIFVNMNHVCTLSGPNFMLLCLLEQNCPKTWSSWTLRIFINILMGNGKIEQHKEHKKYGYISQFQHYFLFMCNEKVANNGLFGPKISKT